MKTLIAYKSFLGTTKQYAEWLGEEIKADVFKFDQITNLSEYDRIIVMSGTYAGTMPLIGFLKKHANILKSKEVYAVANGATLTNSNQEYEKIPKEIRDSIKYVKIMGATPFANKERKAKEIKKENLSRVIDLLNENN